MSELFSQVEFWHWGVLAVALLLLETLTGTFYLLWISFAAAAVGMAMLAAPISWEVQLLLFAGLSVGSILFWHRWRSRHPEPVSDQPALNRRGQQYMGRVFTLDEPIVNGVGKARVDDTSWRISGPDVPAGGKVKVVGVDGATLMVTSAD